MKIKLFLLLVGLAMGQMEVYDLFQEMLEPKSTIYQLGLSNHSGVMAIGPNDDELHIYFNNGSMFTGHQKYSFGRYTIKPIDITPDGKWIAVAGYDKNPDF